MVQIIIKSCLKKKYHSFLQLVDGRLYSTTYHKQLLLDRASFLVLRLTFGRHNILPVACPHITSNNTIIFIYIHLISLITCIVFCWAGQENLTTRVCLLYVCRNQHGTGEKNRRILQTIIPGSVHSIQRAILAVLFTKLNRPHAAANATSTLKRQNARPNCV